MAESTDRRQQIRGWPYEGPIKTSNIRVPAPMYEKFKAVADRNHRTVLVEILLAMEAHIAANREGMR